MAPSPAVARVLALPEVAKFVEQAWPIVRRYGKTPHRLQKELEKLGRSVAHMKVALSDDELAELLKLMPHLVIPPQK
jgi:hypothetical protein